jgi:hypothetical protein
MGATQTAVATRADAASPARLTAVFPGDLCASLA